jgi:hypothetical protein
MKMTNKNKSHEIDHITTKTLNKNETQTLSLKMEMNLETHKLKN